MFFLSSFPKSLLWHWFKLNLSHLKIDAIPGEHFFIWNLSRTLWIWVSWDNPNILWDLFFFNHYANDIRSSNHTFHVKLLREKSLQLMKQAQTSKILSTYRIEKIILLPQTLWHIHWSTTFFVKPNEEITLWNFKYH